MHYTTYQYSDGARKKVGVVMRAGMDGTEPVTVVAGIGDPQGITINFTTSRLFWADSKSDRIESSDFQGGDRRMVVPLSGDGPNGIATADERIYWGGQTSRKLQSCTMAGKDVVTLHKETSSISQLMILVPDLGLRRNRTNNCEGHSCEKVCVLSAHSFRCLE